MLEILDPRPLLDEAARIAAAYGGTGLLVAESVTAALHHGKQLWFSEVVEPGPLGESGCRHCRFEHASVEVLVVEHGTVG